MRRASFSDKLNQYDNDIKIITKISAMNGYQSEIIIYRL